MIDKIWMEAKLLVLLSTVMPVVAYISGASFEAVVWVLAMSIVIMAVLVVDVSQRGDDAAADDISVSEELGQEMDLLMQRVDSSAKDMLGQVHQELSQMRSLVSDAIKILQSSFIDLNQESWAQTVVMRDVLEKLGAASESQAEAVTSNGEDIKELVKKNLKEMSDISQRINASITEAVRSLQFEDIARQLTFSSEKHLNYLDEVLSTVDVGIRNLNSQRINVPEYIIGLHELKSQIDKLEDECRAEVAKSVSQDSMHKGEVTLF